MKSLFLSCALCLAPVLATTTVRAEEAPDKDGWISLFNGKDLSGWTPKITGFDHGDNHANTFRVADGVIKVSYDGYETFAGKFGHLFYKTPYQNYIFRMDYRFTGEQAKDGPGWAFRNSGIMIHGQDPATMAKGQKFPVSLEVQLLGGTNKGERSTANLCTPGTLVSIDGQLRREHCINSSSETFNGDVWVTVEVEARGTTIIHRINGQQVMKYENPVLDENDGEAKLLIKNGEKLLKGGSISLQAESHPVEFRNIKIKPLP